MSKDLTFLKAQRLAFDTLSKEGGNFYTEPTQITMPAFLIQEKALTVATPNPTFSFGSNAPQATAILNNVVLGENDVAQMYGIQVLIGYGATRNVRQYYSYGLTVDDDVVYRGQLLIKFETNDLITTLDTGIFRSENGTQQKQYDGAALINPQRTFTGRTSKVDVQINMGDVSPLLFTPNTFIAVKLWIGLGASSASPKK